MEQTIIQKYAELIVRSGIALKAGEKVIISANVDQEDFVTLLVEEAYRLGAKRVIVQWTSQKVSKANLLYGDEEELLNEYSYMNNLGEIQKWILFFTNGLYPDLFEDLKDYLGNHLKQTVDFIMKKEENISPDELNLSRLVYFNIYFIFSR